MTRTMYDSTNPDDIPADAEMVAYYVDGLYCWPQEWIDRFPNAVKVTISAIGKRTAQVGDVEKGCIWPPANAVDWVLRARADGFDPTIYVNERNDWAPTRAAFDARGVAHPHWWVANYNGVFDEERGGWVASVPAGAVAKQYAHPPMIGKHYDLSVVADYWPGVDSTTDSTGGWLMTLSNAEQQELLDKVRMLYTAVWGPSKDAPVVGGGPGTPETIQDSIQRVARRQQDQIEADRLDDTAIANIETVVNRIDQRGAGAGMTDAERDELAADIAARTSASQQEIVNALKSVTGTITYQTRPTGG
jgi:hypothetical protein